MSRQRQLITKVNVGEYSFDIAINRDILCSAFEKNEELWDMVIATNQDKKAQIRAAFNIEKYVPKFIKDILPEMIKEANSDVNAEEFLEYCNENGVMKNVTAEIYRFALMGFTDGESKQSSQKPKVQVKFTLK